MKRVYRHARHAFEGYKSVAVLVTPEIRDTRIFYDFDQKAVKHDGFSALEDFYDGRIEAERHGPHR
ncbi:hypothetical protein CBM2592_B100349 [Cupriavidus taiwanensis]|nr:hypothetical protein CBM2592_B100349 [Cupriavidus taiwanensis]SOY63048.1 hypothetical protein CBM2588_B130012 [Cupriavidus taiwanensis]SOY98136.1 hypothetical protein CBM2591_B80351 [Cupriavidus taiwanensis]SOZ85176.1 hypothetical protein CBM2618_B130027 [Cupriavidus taiwanensis]SOZ88633.1 hypothetical protein CBM2622_B140029 [Cupriavidus taiwanensis]